MSTDPGGIRDLDAAIRRALDGIERAPVPGPELTARVATLVTLLRRRIPLGTGADLSQVLARARAVLGKLPFGPGLDTGGLAEVTEALRAGAAAHPEGVPFDGYIAFARTVLDRSPPTDPHRPTHLGILAALLYLAWRVDGNRDRLSEALLLRRVAVYATRPGDPVLPERLHLLGAVAREGYEATSDPHALDEAVTAHRHGARSTAATDQWHRTHLAGLSDALRLRHDRDGDAAALRESVDAGLAAVRLCPPGDPDRPRMLDLAALALWQSFTTVGASVLGQAAALSREAVATTTEAADQRGYLANLCGILNSLYAATGDPRVVTEAVEAGRRATAAGRPTHHMWSALADALTNRYRLTGEVPVLDEAITIDRTVLGMTPPENRVRPWYLYRLGRHLQVRYIVSGNPADSDESFDAVRQALAQARPGSTAAALAALTLGEGLLQKAVATSDPAAARGAVDVLRSLVARTPRGDPDRGLYLIDLAGALWQAYTTSRDARLVDEGIAVAHEVLASASLTPVLRTYAETNLGILLMSRYELGGDPADLDAAAAITGRSSTAVASGQPNHALLLANHADVLRLRYLRGRDGAARVATVEAYRQAIAAGPGEARVRIDAAKRLADLAAGEADWPVAAEATRAAIALIPRLAPRHFRLEHKEQVLVPFPGLASDAAAAAVHVRPPEEAVELLEQGRGVLLADLLDARGELDALRVAAPELAERLDRLRQRLDTPPDGSPAAGRTVTAGPDARQPSAAPPGEDLAAAWDELLAQIRSQRGFERFLRPPSAAELRDVGAEGPVVAVNVSAYHSDAFLVTAEGTRVVPLPGLTPDVVWQRVADFGQALATGQDETAAPLRRLRAEQTVRETLGWLWDVLAEPVLAALDLPDPDGGQLPRLWWMPTGPLNFLPVHAAGHYAAPAGPDNTGSPARNLLDRAVSSYAPTLRGLLKARRAQASPTRHFPLVVAVPGELRDVSAEAREIAARYPGGRSLVGRAAERDRVLANLPRAGWVHFACHGYSDVADPSRGHLVLHDGQLSIRDVTRLNLSNAEFALLSACATARGGTRLPDEAIHLTAAFQLAGYRHVVGTLWPVADDVARAVTGGLYATLRPDRQPAGHQQFAGAARALHSTVQEQRRRWPGTPSLWASWIHIGA